MGWQSLRVMDVRPLAGYSYRKPASETLGYTNISPFGSCLFLAERIASLAGATAHQRRRSVPSQAHGWESLGTGGQR